MLEKEGIYSNYSVLEDVGGENGRIHMNLAKLNLDITKDVYVSYFLPNRKKDYEHNNDKISFEEYQHRMLNDKEFQENVFEVVVEGEDYEITLCGGEMWVRSFEKKKADLIYNKLILYS